MIILPQGVPAAKKVGIKVAQRHKKTMKELFLKKREVAKPAKRVKKVVKVGKVLEATEFCTIEPSKSSTMISEPVNTTEGTASDVASMITCTVDSRGLLHTLTVP